jgi:hypothetical protein
MSDVITPPSPAEGSSGSRAEVIAGLVAIGLWFALFVAGTFVGTQTYRDTLAREASTGEKLKAFSIVLFCYTATNVAFLCCIASILGGIFRRMRERQRQRSLPPSLLVLLLSLILQGFVVYLVMVSGVISFGGFEHFLDAPTQDQYLRLAATASLVSLMIGYSPGLFNSLMGRLEKWVQGQGVSQGQNGAPSDRLASPAGESGGERQQNPRIAGR